MATKNTNLDRFDHLSWNRLDHIASTSRNRTVLAGIVHAENACITDGPSHHVRDNRIVANVVDRAIQGNWNDVLESAASSRHMSQREYAAIINAETVFTDDVYFAILTSKAAESGALMSMLQRGTPYPAVTEAALAVRVSLVRTALDAIKADPQAYALDDDEEHPDVFRVVTTAVALDRHDLLAEVIATGCTGSFTAEYARNHDYTLAA
jgi:hypothetical protein